MKDEPSRRTASDIFDLVIAEAQTELERPSLNVAFSAMSAGLAMGLSGVGVATLTSILGDKPSTPALAYLVYPIGFVIVILGRMHLFTENTLFPVALVLEKRRMFRATLRLWSVVLSANVLGAFMFSVLATKTPGTSPEVRAELVKLGLEMGSRSSGEIFWTAVFGGWVIALVAWLVTASRESTGQILVILLGTYIVGVSGFSHSIAGSSEVLAAVLGDDLSIARFGAWFFWAVLGNVVGGVLIVAIFNYGQVHNDEP